MNDEFERWFEERGGTMSRRDAYLIWCDFRSKMVPNKPSKRPKTRTKKQRRLSRTNQRTTRFVDYRKYIKSPAWRMKVRKLIRKRKRCAVCGSTKQLQGHHKTYANLGREPPEDIEILCQPCHSNIHEAEGKCLSPSSEEFVDLMNRIL